MAKPRIILSSSSPRRVELLHELGLEFIIHPSQIEENKITAKTPREFVLKAAFLKATDVASHYVDGIVIAADTVVVIDGEILGKPMDVNHARQMLRRLSGREHQVITAVAICNARTGATLIDTETTSVFFRPLADEEIEDYLRSGDPMDKAGAYGIQTIGERFVEKIEGDYTNVVGLPIKKLSELLKFFLPTETEK